MTGSKPPDPEEILACALARRMEELDPEGDPDLSWEDLQPHQRVFLLGCIDAVLDEREAIEAALAARGARSGPPQGTA